MTPSRLLLSMLLLSACGGGGGPSDDPGGGGTTVVIQKPAVASGEGQSGVVADTLASALVVLVTEDGAPAAGRVVTFSPAAGSGSAVSAVDTTDGAGLAQTLWILGTGVGARTLNASTPGASGSPLTFHATATPGPAATLTLTGGQGQSQEAGLPFGQALIVRVSDTFGNNVPGVVVAWQVLSGTAVLSQTADTTGNDGRSTVTVVAGDSIGAVAVRATAEPLPGAPAQFSLSVAIPSTHIVVASNFFSPATVTISAGGAVRWDWTGTGHNVTQLGGPAAFPASSTQGVGASYGPLVFDVAGVYTYECTVHAGMTGTITVNPTAAPQPSRKH